MIKLSKVSKIYESQAGYKTEALLDINLTILAKEKVVIIGESGAGKSTLINIIGLIDQAYSGEYIFNGFDMKTVDEKDKTQLRNEFFGFVFQDLALIEDESVYDNVVIPLLYSKKFKKNQFQHRVNEILSIVELESMKHKKVKFLSGGQRQRVAIARALINEPEVLIMDEPTGSLNRSLSLEIMKDIYAYIEEKGKILIIVTHDLDKVAHPNSRVIEIDMCKIVRDEPFTDVAAVLESQ